MTFDIAKTYDIVTEVSAVLGGIHKSLTLTAIAGAETASLFKDVSGIHSRIIAQLPVGTPTSVKDLTFYIFETVDKEKIILADPWIESSVLVENVTISIVVTDGSLSYVSSIRQALNSLGLYEVTITTS